METIQVIDLKDYEKRDEIGNSSFGRVYLVIKICDSSEYAAKVYINTKKIENKDSDFYHELITYSKVDNPAILKLYGYSPTIILDYMKNGSLENFLKSTSKKRLTKSEKYFILLGIALAMKKLHSRGIIHRDIKPGNVLLDDNFLPKICDFGCSIISDTELTKFQMENAKGTPIYMAPEIFSDDCYTYKVDVYSFSMVVYETLTGITPFANYKNKYDIMKNKKKGKEPDLSKIKEVIISQFLKVCWNFDPKKRYNFSEIVDIMISEPFYKCFKINTEELFSFLNLFDADLLNEKYDNEFDFDTEIARNNFEAIYYMAAKLYYGIGVKKDREKAAHYYHIASQRGNTNSMFHYARMLQKGYDVKMDKDLAIKFYKMSAFSGNTESIYNYAHMLLQGESVKKDIEKAAKYLKFGCYLLDEQCMLLYSDLLFNELSLYNPIEAKFYLSIGALKMHPPSLSRYATFLFKQSNDQSNLEDGVNYLRKAAKLDFPDAMLRYGYFLWNGIGCEKNQNKAKEYIKKAVDKGNRYYCLIKSPNNEIFFDNDEIFKHFLIAVDRQKDYVNFSCEKYIAIDDWKIINFSYLARQVEIYADNGNTDAMLYYGTLLMYGMGVKMNIKESAKYFKYAADKGNTDAMLRYAYLLFPNKLFKNKTKESIEYLKKSADNGNINAMYSYACECYNGKYVNFDIKKAAKYFKMAADHEIPQKKKENLFLFQSIIEKIAETSFFDSMDFNHLIYIRGDDCIYHYNTYSKYESMKYCVIFALEEESISINRNEVEKYIQELEHFNLAEMSYKQYLDIQMNKFKRKVNDGDINSMHKYSLMLINGDGVRINIQKGIKLLKISADKGNSESMLQYATILFNGQNVDTNKKESFKYFKMAADQGNVEALKIFYNLVIKRNEIEIEYKEKVNYIKKLAEIGNDDAMYEYGLILNDINKQEAAKYFKQSADKGNVLSMNKYGLMLYNCDVIVVNVRLWSFSVAEKLPQS